MPSGTWKPVASGVSTPLGASAFTRNGVLMYSIASARVNWTTAPLLMQYTTVYA